ncbi:MAG: hypothetical protein JXA66_05940 [Oligoflexia bacterium]|nr:hypothetical protein [Oligoflexia bacterium]
MKYVLYTFIFTATHFLHAAPLSLDITGHYTRQVSTPGLNMMGADLAISYMLTDAVAVELPVNTDFYSITYNNNVKYNFTDLNYGAGLRFYLNPKLFIKGSFGRLYRRYSYQGSSSSDSDWRYGGALSYLYPLTEKIMLNAGAGFFRYHNNQSYAISTNAGFTFQI